MYHMTKTCKETLKQGTIEIAEEFGLIFVPLQEVFDEASKTCEVTDTALIEKLNGKIISGYHNHIGI